MSPCRSCPGGGGWLLPRRDSTCPVRGRRGARCWALRGGDHRGESRLGSALTICNFQLRGCEEWLGEGTDGGHGNTVSKRTRKVLYWDGLGKTTAASGLLTSLDDALPMQDDVRRSLNHSFSGHLVCSVSLPAFLISCRGLGAAGSSLRRSPYALPVSVSACQLVRALLSAYRCMCPFRRELEDRTRP